MPLSAYSIDMPCKGYIKKYFNCLYGNPVPLDHSSDFGDTILTKIAAIPLSRVSKKILTIAAKDNNDQLKFVLPLDTFYRINPELSGQQAYSINRYLENVFETDLCMMVAVAGVFGVERKVNHRAIRRKVQDHLGRRYYLRGAEAEGIPVPEIIHRKEYFPAAAVFSFFGVSQGLRQ